METPPEVVTFKWFAGTVDVPRGTGRWLQTSDGGWYEERTPWRERDASGVVVRERPAEIHAVIYYD